MFAYWRPYLRVFVALFVVWHMAAVTYYALPGQGTNWIPRPVHEAIQANIQPYLFTLSQWQIWNLFAPDPLRRVSEYHVDAYDVASGTWQRLDTIKPGRFPVWRHTGRFKVYADLLEGDAQLHPIVESFLHGYCQRNALQQNTLVRLQVAVYVLPKDGKHHTIEWWKSYVPDYSVLKEHSTRCPLT